MYDLESDMPPPQGQLLAAQSRDMKVQGVKTRGFISSLALLGTAQQRKDPSPSSSIPAQCTVSALA